MLSIYLIAAYVIRCIACASTFYFGFGLVMIKIVQ